MKIVHFSDWHGDRYRLPPGDLYACTGDTLPNFRIFDIEVAGKGTVRWEENLDLVGETPRPRPEGKTTKRPPDPAREAEFQVRYLERLGPGYMRKLMAEPRAPVVCLRGNHDFIEVASAFAGGPVFEISDDPTRVLAWQYPDGPLKIGGVRGVKLHHGRWSDELTHEEFTERAARLPKDLDVLVTHAPPEGILDEIPGELIGSPALRSYVARHDPALPPLKAHLFGHVHESKGMRELGGTLFSNAARGWQVIEF